MNLGSKWAAVVTAGIALCLAQNALAAKKGEQDSAYRWGRWAVLSPAAGGAEPYVAASMPGADYNAVPEIADTFGRGITFDTPVTDDPRDRPPPPPPSLVIDDPRDRPAPPQLQ